MKNYYSKFMVFAIITIIISLFISGCKEEVPTAPATQEEQPAETFAITFDKNDVDATGTMENQLIQEGSTRSLRVISFVKTGYNFAGWATTSGGIVVYNNGDNYTMGNQDVTLYAKWTATGYTVTFNSSGGSTPSPVNKIVNFGSTYGTLATTTRTNYSFAGWWTEAGGSGTQIQSTTTVNITSNQTLYAKWNINTYKITYNGNGSNGGSVPVDNTNYNHGSSVTVANNTGYLRKINVGGVSYRFDGWQTVSGGVGGTHYPAGTGTFTITSNITVYARWIAYQLRDRGPANGWIYYDKGYYSNGWRYREAAPDDQSTNIKWYNDSYVETGAIGEELDYSKINTETIVSVQGIGNYAASLCNNLVINGYSDWYLPSTDDLRRMCWNLRGKWYGEADNPDVPVGGVGGFVDFFYWSSTEVNYQTTKAWYINFGIGLITYGSLTDNKHVQMRVRAVRQF